MSSLNCSRSILRTTHHTLNEKLTHIICTCSHIMHTNCKVGRIGHMSAFPCVHTPTGRLPFPPSLLFSDVFFMLTLCSALGTPCSFPPYTALPSPFRMFLRDNIVFIFQLNFYTFVFFPLFFFIQFPYVLFSPLCSLCLEKMLVASSVLVPN